MALAEGSQAEPLPVCSNPPATALELVAAPTRAGLVATHPGPYLDGRRLDEALRWLRRNLGLTFRNGLPRAPAPLRDPLVQHASVGIVGCVVIEELRKPVTD